MSIPRDPEDMNAARSQWADLALKAFQKKTRTDAGDALCDLLADLMHWADRNNFDFSTELSRAEAHYEEETDANLHRYVEDSKVIMFPSQRST